MYNLRYTLVFLFLFSAIFFAAPIIEVYYFYGEGCPHCAKVMPYVETLDYKYDEIEVQYFEVYNDRSNAQVLYNLFLNYGVPTDHQGIPIVFIGNTYITGDQPIMDYLENVIQDAIASMPDNDSSVLPTNDTIMENPIALVYGGHSALEADGISLVVLTGAALVDSINPCAIAVLIILLGTLLMAGNKKKALYSGLAFITSLYIMYFLFGIGLMGVIQFTGFSYLFYQFVGILAIIIGILNLKDYFSYGAGGFVMEIPRSWRPLLKKFLSSVTSPAGAFLMGFIVVLFELPCTGGPYVFILGLLAEKTMFWTAVPMLLYYNLIFVLPLILLTFMMHFGITRISDAEKWKDRNIKLLHLVAGLLMIVLGTAVLFRIV